jgi:hypothetical protein
MKPERYICENWFQMMWEYGIFYVELAMHEHCGMIMWNLCKRPYNLVNSSLNLLIVEKTFNKPSLCIVML